MILFCDTSALIKLLIEEPGTPTVQRALAQAEVLAVCRIAWVESIAAMARRQREQPEDGDLLDQARQRLSDSWGDCLVVEINQELVERAGRLADAFALRAYDSVQLAAAHHLMVNSQLPLTFACFDRRLNQAAGLLQMQLLG